MKAHIVPWFIVGLLASGCARADSWSAPQVQVIVSPDSETIARIVPGERGVAKSHAKAIVMRYSPASGGYEKIAQFDLRNQVAPHVAVLSDRAEFLVAFDDWAQLGRTSNVVVVYRGTGEFLKAWSLADIFSDAERKHFIESVSSTWWRGDVAIFTSSHQRPVVIIQPESRMASLEEGRKKGDAVLLDLDTLSFRKR